MTPQEELADVRKVRLTKKAMDEFASRDLSGHRVIWRWGEPDSDGFYSPTINVDFYDDLARKERERIMAAACRDEECLEDHAYVGFHDNPFIEP